MGRAKTDRSALSRWHVRQFLVASFPMHRLYVHLVWTTRGRAPLLDASVARFLCRVLRPLARKERARLLEIGMVRSHVHVLARVRTTATIAGLAQRLKGASSELATQDGIQCPDAPLYWAKGYSAHTVSPRSLDIVRRYLRGQPEHHPREAIEGWDGDSDPEPDEGLPRLKPRLGGASLRDA